MHNKTQTLSIVIPAYNEANFIGVLLEKIAEVNLASLGLEKEIIVINDCSADQTAEIVRRFDNVILLEHTVNSGKGMAVRTGLDKATGDFLIIQDADLEYDPEDYIPMLEPLLSNKADVIYGSRYMKHPEAGVIKNLLTGKHPEQSWVAYLGGQSLSFVSLLFTGRFLSDTVTAYKLFKSPIIKNLALETTGFELDHEISAKVLSSGHRIMEVPISYLPRTVAEGKKIGLKDWFCAIRTFFRYRNG
ncbi:MAG: glycosyltransferase [Gammaproteobacteria bacterium]|nr:glycosyltransferase [Gammaproteobacteria bacterium]